MRTLIILCALGLALYILERSLPATVRNKVEEWSVFFLSRMQKFLLYGVFFAVVTPIGLIRRTIHDPLDIKSWKSAASMFKSRSHTYVREDLIHLF